MKMLQLCKVFTALTFGFSLPFAAAETFSGESQHHDDLRDAACQEGELVVYSVTSSLPMLVEEFRRVYPEIDLTYVAMDTTPLYDRIIEESRGGRVADIAWSSAMDLQVKLVDDGYAMSYESPEIENIPSWAVWRNQAFGTSFEPVGIVYNKTLFDTSEIPQSRSDFAELLSNQADKFKGKVIAFDPVASGLGYLLMTQDEAVSAKGFWRLAQAMSSSDIRPQSGSGTMFRLISSGDAVIGYNLLGSYAMQRARKDLPELGLVLLHDYTLVISRVMFIVKDAPHPNAAKLWLDFVLSKRGQQIISDSGLGSVRTDVTGEFTPVSLEEKLGKAIKPIGIDSDTLIYGDAVKRQEFLDRWKHTTENP